MALSATSVRLYCAANHPENDTDTVGGAIDTACRILEDQFSGAAKPELVSDDAGDLMAVTITGRDPDGNRIEETNALNGLSAVLWTNSFERILKVEFASAPTGDVTIKEGSGGTTRHTVLGGETGVQAFFINATADITAGDDKVRYEKFFVKNIESSDAALNFTVELTVNPRTDYALQVEDAVDDNNSATNRLTAPTGNQGSFSAGPISIPGTDLGAGEAIGVWLRQTLDDGTSPGFDEPVLQPLYQAAS